MTTDRKGDRAADVAVNSAADLLSRAAKVRRHALFFAEDPFGDRLEKYADELEAQANRLA